VAKEQGEYEDDNDDDDNGDTEVHKAKCHRFKLLSSVTTMLSMFFSLL
jgi:hypothetical protein